MDNIQEILTAAMNKDVTRLNTISHNLANVNTTGYRAQGIISQSFSQELLSRLGGLENQLPLAQAFVSDSVGSLKPTKGKLDVALQTSGFFEVKNENGETFYTRNGKFSLNNNFELVNASGYKVQGQSGAITLSNNDINIDADGSIRDNNALLDRIKVVYLTNVASVTAAGDGVYKYNDSPEEIAPEKISLKQGYLESSNVNTMTEMVNLIELMRSFEAKQKIVTNYDQMLNSLMNEVNF